MPIEGVVLQMKSMHIDAVINFPFPTPPERSTLRQAEAILTHLGALNIPGTETVVPQITELGKTMSLYPLSPRFSRMLVSGQQHGCLPYVISTVSALSVGNPFLYDDEFQDEDEDSSGDNSAELTHLSSSTMNLKKARRLRRKAFFESQHVSLLSPITNINMNRLGLPQTHAALGQHTSDVLKILSVVGAYEYAGGGHKFCSEHFVRPKVCQLDHYWLLLTDFYKTMEEIHKLRAQISSIVQTNFPGADTGYTSNLRPPNALQVCTM